MEEECYHGQHTHSRKSEELESEIQSVSDQLLQTLLWWSFRSLRRVSWPPG